MKKAAVFAVSFLFLALALFPQSLAELAKKEKERRESLKGKKISVVTEAELAKIKLEPALSVPLPEYAVAPGRGLPAEPQQQQMQQQPAEKAQTPPLRTEAQQQAILKDVSGQDADELAKKHERAKERLDLLTLKMNALWQQFYSLDNMMPQGEIQRQISETYAKLLQAQEEETAAREELQRALALRKK